MMREVESEWVPKKHSAGSSSNSCRNDPEIEAMSSRTTQDENDISHTALNIPADCSTTIPCNYAQYRGLPSRREFVAMTNNFQLLPTLWAVFLLLCVVCLCALALVLFFSGLIMASIAVIPLVLVSIWAARLLQFITRGEYYYNLLLFKIALRTWMCINVVLLLIVTGIFFPIAKYVPALKHVVIAGLPLTKWLIITCLMCTLYAINCLLSGMAFFMLKGHMSVEPISGDNGELYEAATDVISGFIFWWAVSEVRNRVPLGFDHHRLLLGLPTYKWVEVPTFIFIGYSFIRFSTLKAPLWIWKAYRKLNSKSSSSSYYELYSLIEKLLFTKHLAFFVGRMRRSINFMSTSLLLLLTWVLYFRSHLKVSKSILDYGTWTFFSLFICSLLWLIKTCVLLSLEVNSVYNRLQYKILEAGKQLYLLFILRDGKHAVVNFPGFIRFKEHLFMHQRHQKCTPTIYDVYKVAQFILVTKAFLSEGTYVSAIVDALKNQYQDGADWYLNVNDYFKQLFRDVNNRTDVAQDTSRSPRANNSSDLSQDSIGSPRGESPKDVRRNSSESSRGESSNDVSRDLGGSSRGKRANNVTQYSNRSTGGGDSNDVSQDSNGSSRGKRANDVTQDSNRSLKGDNCNDASRDSSGASRGKCANDVAQSSNRSLRGENPNDASRDSGGSPRGKRANDVTQSSNRFLRGENPDDVSQTGGMEMDDWEYFHEYLKNVGEDSTTNDNFDSSGEMCFEKVRTWMERLRNSCLFLTNTIRSAEEVVDCLNKIVSAVIIGAIFVMWLLLTGLATTKVFVLIASPLLAATFIFGDTCKTLFQGIIFVYVTHPFDVGDLCVIDDKMMEVKAIGVWITTFSKVGTQGEVIYPNTELATKVVVNHGTEFDWHDHVEFHLGSLGQEEIDILTRHVENHLKQEKFTPNAHSIEILETGDQITKITVCFKHKVARNEDRTYSECLRHKHKLRYEFALHVKTLIKGFENATERRDKEQRPKEDK